MSKSDAGHASAALENLPVLRRHADSAIEDATGIGADAHAFGATWTAMWSTRNRITHRYTFVNRDVILATVERDLDDFKTGLCAIVSGAPPHVKS